MDENPLKSLAAYSRLVAESVNRPEIERSTVAVWSSSPYTAIAEGEVFFTFDSGNFSPGAGNQNSDKIGLSSTQRPAIRNKR